MKTRVAVAVEAGKPLEITEVDLEGPVDSKGRHDKATSNICTAQALLANIVASFAIWHSPSGLQAISERIHSLASRLAENLKAAGISVLGDKRFDTITIEAKGKAKTFATEAEKTDLLLRVIDDEHVSVAFDET